MATSLKPAATTASWSRMAGMPASGATNNWRPASMPSEKSVPNSAAPKAMQADTEKQPVHRQALGDRPAAPRRRARPGPPEMGHLLADHRRRPGSHGSYPGQGPDRPASAATPPGLDTHVPAAGRLPAHGLGRQRPALFAAGTPVGPGHAFRAAAARDGLPARAAPADGLL